MDVVYILDLCIAKVSSRYFYMKYVRQSLDVRQLLNVYIPAFKIQSSLLLHKCT